jgi:hypothetical protein
MLSPYIYLAFAHARQDTFLAQAEADRRASQTRLRRRRAGTRGARNWRLSLRRGGVPAGPARPATLWEQQYVRRY